MNRLRRSLLVGVPAVLASTLVASCGRRNGTVNQAKTVAIVTKALGIGFFDAVQRGANEAAGELTGLDILFTGPPNTASEAQIDILEGLIARRVELIAISANDPDALLPSLKRAMARGIKVISYDSAVAPQGRLVHLSWASDQAVGETCLELAAAAAPGGRGAIAILSATPSSPNQNAWIEVMKRALPAKPGLQLLETVYGDDVADKSYRETIALIRKYPQLAVIIAPTSVGLVAAAKAIEDQGLTGKLFVTGLGLPSEVAGHLAAGSVRSFALGNPMNLGYAVVEIAAQILQGAAAGPGLSLPAGRLGTITFDAQGNGDLGRPAIFDASNIEQFAKQF